MTLKNTLKKAALLGTVIASTLLSSKALAQSNSPLAKIDTRAKTEYLEEVGEKFTLQSTLGFAPEGSYSEVPICNKGQFCESFRIYDVYQKETNSKDSHYTAFGFKFPQFKPAEAKTDLITYASAGDIEGFGAELSPHITDNLTLTLNADKNITVDTHRLGGALTYRITPKLETTFGFDHIDIEKHTARTEQYLANLIYDLTEKDTLGLAAVLSDNSKSQDRGLGAFWIHYNDNWGTRARVRVDQNVSHGQTSKKESLDGEIIVAQKPTTGRLGATWIVGRNVVSDDKYARTIFPQSISLTEGVRLPDRASAGYSFIWKGTINGDNGSTTAGAAYTFHNKILGAKVGVSQEFQYVFTPTENTYSSNTGLIVRKDFWETDLVFSIPFSADPKNNQPFVRAAVQVHF